jgi:hypothetical protein
VGFEPTISVLERAKTVRALDHSYIYGTFAFSMIFLSEIELKVAIFLTPIFIMQAVQ